MTTTANTTTGQNKHFIRLSLKNNKDATNKPVHTGQEEKQFWETHCPRTKGGLCDFGSDDKCTMCGREKTQQHAQQEQRQQQTQNSKEYTERFWHTHCPMTQGGHCSFGPNNKCRLCGREKQLKP